MLLEYERQQLEIKATIDWESETLHYIYNDLWRLSQKTEQDIDEFGLERLLQVANTAKATDLRDKVYGLIGLMDKTLSDKLEPDYSLGTRDVYISIARRRILAIGGPGIIREGNHWGKMNIPSWAPDWTWSGQIRDDKPFMNYNMPTQPPPTISFSKDESILTCKGILIDEIEGLGARELERLNYSCDTVEHHGTHHSIYGNFEATRKALCYALVEGRKVSGEGADDGCQTIINLRTDSESSTELFHKLGWKDFIIEQDNHYKRWINWYQAKNTF